MLLDCLDVDERWDVLDVASAVFGGESIDYCIELAELFADIAAREVAASRDGFGGKSARLDRSSIWDYFLTAVESHHTESACPAEWKYEVVETIVEEQSGKRFVTEILSIEDADPPVEVYEYEQEAIVNSLQDAWELRLYRKYAQNRAKRLRRKPKNTDPPPAGFVIEDFELPEWVGQKEPEPAYPGVDHVRRRLNRAKRKFLRYVRWIEADFNERSSAIAQFWHVELQSGTTKAKREERDVQQREAAKARAKMLHKQVPKREREADVKSKRDKRNPAFQSSKFLSAAAGAGVAMLVGKLWKLMDRSERAVDAARGIIDHLRRTGEELKRHLGKALWHIPIVLTVFFAVKHYAGVNGLIASALVMALCKLLGPKLWSVVSEFFPEGGVRAQAGVSDVFNVAPKLLATLFCFSVLGSKRHGTISEFCKRLSLLERMSGGWEVFLKWMLKAIEVLINYVRKLFGKERIELLKEVRSPIMEWAKRVDDILLGEATGAQLSADRIDEMVKLVQEGSAYKEICRGTSSAKFVDDYYVKIATALMPYNGSLNARKNHRQEPAMLMLHGSPGIGKTLMAMPLCAAIMLEGGLLPYSSTYDDIVKQIWQKGNSEYWNGYVGQKCLVMDDAFQQRADTSDKENDYMSVIRMVSTWSFPLNFADLASKGKIYFDSKFIFATTNLTSIDSEARIVIHEPDAVARRINFPYTIRVKDEFASDDGGSRRLNYRKFLQERMRSAEATNPLDKFPWHVWEAAEHNFLTGQTSNSWRPLKEVIQLVAADVRRRSASFQDEAENLRAFIGGYNSEELRLAAEKRVRDHMARGAEVPAIGWQPDLGDWPQSVGADDVLGIDVNGVANVMVMPAPEPAPVWEGVEEPEYEAEFQAGYRMRPDGTVEGFDLSILPADVAVVARDLLLGKSFNEVAGLNKPSVEEETRAYRRLIMLVHPDRVVHFTQPGASRDQACRICTEAARMLNDAYDRVCQGRRKNLADELFKSWEEQSKLAKLAFFALGFVLAAMAMHFFVATLGFLLRGVWNFVSSLFGSKKAKIKKTQKTTQQSNRPLTGTRKVGMRDPIFQSVDSSARTVAGNIYANTYKLYVPSTGAGELVVGQIMFLVDKLAVQPAHFSRTIRDMLADGEVTYETVLQLRNAGNHELTLNFSVKHYLELRRFAMSQRDVEFIDFGTVRAHKNIVGNFVKEADLKHLPGYRCRLDVCEVDNNKRIVSENSRKVYVVQSVARVDNVRAGGKLIERTWRYNAPTNVGDCGAPLCVLDSSLYNGRACMGFHVAGDVSRELGFAAIVTQDMIKEAMATLAVIDDQFEKDLADRGVSFQACNELPFQKKGSFLPLVTVDKPVVICPKTSYYPTDLFGSLGEYDCVPAHLSPVWKDGEIIYPMENAVAPYSSPVYIYEQPWLKQALHVAMTPLLALTKDMPRRLYTFEEATLGIPEVKFRSIPRGTAAGFPYIYDVRNGKKEFFGDGQQYDLTLPKAMELRARVEYILEQARKGVRLSHIFVDFLKDELRSSAKVEAVATRLISSAPLDYTEAWRILFGAFSSAVMRVHTRSGMAPGINVYTDASMLAEKLQEKGDKCFDGDFKAFDSSEQPVIHELILDAINRWYDDGPENALARRVLWLDLVHSRHIGGTGCDQRHVYQWNKSLPSGHPFTTIVNSIYSLFLLVAAYIARTGDMTGFWQHVSSVVYGDDNVSNVDDETAEVFNQVTVAETLEKEFKVRYTPGNKTGVFEPVTDLSQITFLKRRIVERDNCWLCPLELDSFLYTCYWCKNRKLEKSIMIDVLENALEELSMHDPRVWNEYAPKVAEILGMRNHVTRAIVEQDQYLALVRNRTDAWY